MKGSSSPPLCSLCVSYNMFMLLPQHTLRRRRYSVASASPASVSAHLSDKMLMASVKISAAGMHPVDSTETAPPHTQHDTTQISQTTQCTAKTHAVLGTHK